MVQVSLIVSMVAEASPQRVTDIADVSCQPVIRSANLKSSPWDNEMKLPLMVKLSSF
jgi:hypothetical protein